MSDLDQTPPRRITDRALCGDLDPEWFYPESYLTRECREQIAVAKNICTRCPVVVECLRWAVETDQRHGIWGATTPDERQRLRRRKRAA